MVYSVGPKGQVVINKVFRDRLGVETGWLALQRLVDDHVEIYFLPPMHRQSLKGSLAGQIRRHVGRGDAWAEARETAWSHAARDRVPTPEQE